MIEYDFKHMIIYLENCEKLTIPKSCIEYLNIDKVYKNYEFVESFVLEEKNVSCDIQIVLNHMANKPSRECPDEKNTFDRLTQYNDIVKIVLVNANHNTVLEVYPLWWDTGDYDCIYIEENKYQKSILEDGELEITISKENVIQ